MERARRTAREASTSGRLPMRVLSMPVGRILSCVTALRRASQQRSFIPQRWPELGNAAFDHHRCAGVRLRSRSLPRGTAARRYAIRVAHRDVRRAEIIPGLYSAGEMRSGSTDLTRPDSERTHRSLASADAGQAMEVHGGARVRMRARIQSPRQAASQVHQPGDAAGRLRNLYPYRAHLCEAYSRVSVFTNGRTSEAVGRSGSILRRRRWTGVIMRLDVRSSPPTMRGLA